MIQLLLQNLLIRSKKILNKNSEYKLKKIKASDEQKELIKKNPKIFKKAYVAQKIYNAGFWFLIVSIFMILFISYFPEDSYLYKMGSLMMTAIAIPVIISLSVISFEQMSEIDDATIYAENDTSTNTEEIKLLKSAIEELSKSNNALKKNIDIINDISITNEELKENIDTIKKDLQQQNYKKKTHRKYR